MNSNVFFGGSETNFKPAKLNIALASSDNGEQNNFGPESRRLVGDLPARFDGKISFLAKLHIALVSSDNEELNNFGPESRPSVGDLPARFDGKISFFCQTSHRSILER